MVGAYESFVLDDTYILLDGSPKNVNREAYTTGMLCKFPLHKLITLWIIPINHQQRKHNNFLQLDHQQSNSFFYKQKNGFVDGQAINIEALFIVRKLKSN